MNAGGQGSVYAVEIRPAPEDVPLLEEALSAAGLACSAWTETKTRTACVRVLCETPQEAEATARRITEFLLPWREMFSRRLPPLRTSKIEQEDWANSWKEHFHAFRASRRLLVKPSWEAVAAGPGDIVLELDPGMCFGTGYHGTTRACLEFMDDLSADLGPVSFLDAGCGSGILCLAAHALGYNPIHAFDHDPQAVRTTRENLSGAGVDIVCPVVAEIGEFTAPVPFRVVAANILAPVLVQNAKTVSSWVDVAAVPSYLLLSGILTEQYEEVRQRYTKQGFREVRTRTIDEWTSGCFRRD